ncbi:hypothetical protein GJ744_003075 [Endocarpon pusillum]|uniref:Uncharacterized protein n=1 Tax=Endocarpon pusillum TaxID=364733 RepID=A0A8H7A735_9EURO|nr:hypothetical protein GJ744_003075 [Endocarpon pusillum]
MKTLSDLIGVLLYMSQDSGSNGGDVGTNEVTFLNGDDDVPDLISDTSGESDMDHEESDQHQVLQNQLDRRAQMHERLLEAQARMEELERQVRELDEQTRQLTERNRQLEQAHLDEQARLDQEIALVERELANQVEGESSQADKNANQVEEKRDNE